MFLPETFDSLFPLFLYWLHLLFYYLVHTLLEPFKLPHCRSLSFLLYLAVFLVLVSGFYVMQHSICIQHTDHIMAWTGSKLGIGKRYLSRTQGIRSRASPSANWYGSVYVQSVSSKLVSLSVVNQGLACSVIPTSSNKLIWAGRR